jgi:endogenous inhibitor of DNA gyrase (YacG/DUF329 family)
MHRIMMAMTATVSCPICSAPLMAEGSERPASFPFCSRRCQYRDLGAWFNGSYVIAGENVDVVGMADELDRDRV